MGLGLRMRANVKADYKQLLAKVCMEPEYGSLNRTVEFAPVMEEQEQEQEEGPAVTTPTTPPTTAVRV